MSNPNKSIWDEMMVSIKNAIDYKPFMKNIKRKELLDIHGKPLRESFPTVTTHPFDISYLKKEFANINHGDLFPRGIENSIQKEKEEGIKEGYKDGYADAKREYEEQCHSS